MRIPLAWMFLLVFTVPKNVKLRFTYFLFDSGSSNLFVTFISFLFDVFCGVANLALSLAASRFYFRVARVGRLLGGLWPKA